MRKLSLILAIAIFAGSFLSLENVFANKKEKGNFFRIQKEMEEQWEGIPVDQRNGWKQYKRWEEFWKERTFPTGDFPNTMEIYKEYKQFQNSKHIENSTLSTTWELVGPVEQPEAGMNDGGNGRVNCIRIHPENPNELWIGASTGGIWKSIDGGENWQVFDFTQFLSIGINDIAFAESNPNIIYAATGDAFGIGHSALQSYSIGIIKTVDGGENWEITGFSYELEEEILVSRLIVHPNDPDNVVAATNNGIYKTTDGGESWEQKYQYGTFMDMEMKPGDPNILYASTFNYGGQIGIYRTTDNGENWEKVESYGNATRAALAVTPDHPEYIYALASRTGYHSFHSMKASTNSGEEWIDISHYSNSINILGRGRGVEWDSTQGQGHYDLCIAANPTQGETLFIGGINIWKSNGSGGYSFELNTHWTGGYNKPYVHADIHDLVYSRDGSVIYSTNDGGVYKSTDGGNTWINISSGLSITQNYKMGASQSDPNLYIGGTQDNGTMIYDNGQWREVLGGDGMDCAIDPKNPNRIYGSLYYGNFRMSNDRGNNFQPMINENVTGENGDWTAPMAQDQVNPSNIIVGFENVWISNNYGQWGSWRKISDFGSARLQVLAIADGNENVIYAASNTRIYKTTDGGAKWDVIHSSKTAITGIEIHPTNHDKIWITKSGFLDGDKVYEFDGQNLKNISGNLPNVPVNVVKYQKNSPDRLYIGTDIGMFYTDYNSVYWARYGSGMPNVIIKDIELNYNSNEVIAATYGRGIWKADIETCNVPAMQVEALGETEFCDSGSITLRYLGEHDDIVWSNGETSKEITVSESGIYSVRRETQDGCIVKSEGIIVTVHETPELLITTYNDYQLCPGGELSLRAEFGFEEYEWNTGDTTRVINVSEPGEYWVKGVTKYGCADESEIFTVYIDEPEKPTIAQHGKVLVSSKAASYSWFYEGTRKLGASDREYVIKDGEDGLYQVETKNASGCEAMSEEYNAIASVNELQEGEFIKVHPNPSTGKFTIQSTLKRNNSFDIEIVDLKGQMVRKIENIMNLSNVSEEFDISNQPAGTYYIRIKGHNNAYNFVEKLIKK